jgi:hypothetical protein
MPFLPASGQAINALLRRLRENGWWGQVVGGHGTGKSSLLCALLPAIREAGHEPLLVELHDGQRRLPGGLRSIAPLRRPAVLLVDGYEQLARWNRFRLKQFCRRRGLGLLVTVHRPAGLPELFVTAVDVEQGWRIVTQLQEPYRPLVSRQDLADCLGRHDGDLREALFDLYDLYHRRNRQS